MMRRLIPRAAWLLALWCSTGYAAEPAVTALVFTPPGEALVCGSQAGLHTRSVADLAERTPIETSLEQIHGARFSPAGDRLVIVGGVPAEEGRLEILEWPSRQRGLTLTIGEDLLYSAVWLDTGTKIAVAGFDGTASLIDVERGAVAGSLRGHSRGVTSIVALGRRDASDGEAPLVTGSIDQTLRVWQRSTGETIRTLHNHTAPVHALALQPSTGDGLPVVASIADDRTVRFWQPTIGRMMRFARLKGVPLCLVWSAGGEQVLVGCDDGHVVSLNPDTAEVLQDQSTPISRITSIAISSSQGDVAIGGPDGQVLLLSP